MGNVRKACRYYGVARSTFYLWRDRHRALGGEGQRRADPPAAGAAEPASVLRAYAVTLEGDAATEAPPEPDLSAETRRQLEMLGYTD